MEDWEPMTRFPWKPYPAEKQKSAILKNKDTEREERRIWLSFYLFQSGRGEMEKEIGEVKAYLLKNSAVSNKNLWVDPICN